MPSFPFFGGSTVPWKEGRGSGRWPLKRSRQRFQRGFRTASWRAAAGTSSRKPPSSARGGSGFSGGAEPPKSGIIGGRHHETSRRKLSHTIREIQVVMSDGRPTLWHISVSHYSEKARWALDHKQLPHRRRAVSIPGLHIPA